jgi:hypothetical protein
MPAWVGSEPKWEKAKKLAKKQYPKAKGSRFWKLVAGIYKQMGAPMKKAIVYKSAAKGSAHKTHRYLKRTGGPGEWQYEYDADNDEDTDSPTNDASPSVRNKTAGVRTEDASGTAEGFVEPESGKPSGKQDKAVGLKLDIGKSILRDAQPEDLENPSIVLWRCIDVGSLDALRQKGKFIGEESDGGTIASGTRVGALAMGEDDKTPNEDALVAMNVSIETLEPIPPAATVEESLFPENPGMSAVRIVGSIPGNAVVGVVQEGDALWPSELPDEGQQGVDEQQQDSDNELQLSMTSKLVLLRKRR